VLENVSIQLDPGLLTIHAQAFGEGIGAVEQVVVVRIEACPHILYSLLKGSEHGRVAVEKEHSFSAIHNETTSVAEYAYLLNQVETGEIVSAFAI
jgi:hypothetical protein